MLKAVVCFSFSVVSASAAGPKAPEVFWDSYAYGWAQAASRPSQLLDVFIASRGLMARVHGSSGIKNDELVGFYETRQIAVQWLKNQSSNTLELIQAFVAGVNASLALHDTELTVEQRKQLPITSTDVMANISRSLLIGFGAYGSSHPLSKGSNAWALAPRIVESRSAILYGAPHLPWDGDNIWCEVHVNLPSLKFYGFGFLGMPFCAIGFIDKIAWSHTVNGASRSDKIIGSVANNIFYCEYGSSAVVDRELVVRVQGGQPVIKSYKKTSFGPLQKGGEDVAHVIYMRDQNVDGMIDQYWAMMEATSLQARETALSKLQSPVFNTVRADAAENIAYIYSGLSLRSVGPDKDGSKLAANVYPYSELPRFVNPEGGWVQSTNDSPRYATSISIAKKDFNKDFDTGLSSLRSQPSRQTLAGTSRWNLDQVVYASQSTRPLLGKIMVPQLLKFKKDFLKKKYPDVFEVLQNWDQSFESTSNGAVLFYYIANEIRSKWGDISSLNSAELSGHLESALSKLSIDSIARNAAWGEIFRLDGLHRGRGAPSAMGVLCVTDYEISEKLWTANGGDSCSFVVQLSDPLVAKARLNGGNRSGQSTQLGLFEAGSLREVLWGREVVEDGVVRRDLLEMPIELASNSTVENGGNNLDRTK